MGLGEASAREDLAMQLQMLQKHILPYVAVPKESVRLKALKAATDLLGVLPLLEVKRTGDKLTGYFQDLQTQLNIIIAANKNVGFSHYLAQGDAPLSGGTKPSSKSSS